MKHDKGTCQFGTGEASPVPSCTQPATRKWGDHWFCDTHGERKRPDKGELASALVRHRIVHPDAVECSEGYDNCETLANISQLHMELFPVTPSYPPALDRARKRYNAALAAYESASLHEDDSGEAIPQDIRHEYREAARQLKEEEQAEQILAMESELKSRLSRLSQPAKDWLRSACNNIADGQGYPPNNQLRKECEEAGFLTIKRGGYVEIQADVMHLVYTMDFLKS